MIKRIIAILALFVTAVNVSQITFAVSGETSTGETVIDCGNGEHYENGMCVGDSKPCSIANSSDIRKSYWENGAWGACLGTDTCNSGYSLIYGVCILNKPVEINCGNGEHYENGMCVGDSKPCSPKPGSLGEIIWTNGSWSASCPITKCEVGYSMFGGSCYKVHASITTDFIKKLEDFHKSLQNRDYTESKDIKDVMRSKYSSVISSNTFSGFPESKKESYKLFIETISE